MRNYSDCFTLKLTLNSVLLIQKASPETIIQFHDQLSNELPTLKGKWNFNFKIFRNNPYSIAPEVSDKQDISSETKFLYTLSPSYLIGSTITLLNKKSSGIFSCSVEEELNETGQKTDFFIPNNHLHRGATSGLNDGFDIFATQKLNSLWTLKQNVRGEAGQIYELENGNVCIRTANVFLHGNFKGLLIQIDIQENIDSVNDVESLRNKFIEKLTKHNIPIQNMCCDVLDVNLLDAYGDLCLQYAEILNF